LPSADRYLETWQAFEKILSDGRARAIGVSNFHVPHLERLAAETGTVPAVNQIELHPYLQQPRLRAYHREHGIATEAWGPLARGGALLGEERLVGMAESYSVSPAQIVLRWHMELGNIVIPKSVRPERMRENLDVLGFELAADDMATLGELDADHRTGPDPDTFG
jgi:2,5-diketo-D-gluconate reductase A